jgi:hypothetical protein
MIYHIITAWLLPVIILGLAGWGLAWLIEEIINRHE